MCCYDFVFSLIFIVPITAVNESPVSTKTTQYVEKVWLAEITIIIDDDKLLQFRLQKQKVVRSITSFFRKQKKFSLDDLRQMKIPNVQGVAVPLRLFVRFEVAFEKRQEMENARQKRARSKR